MNIYAESTINFWIWLVQQELLILPVLFFSNSLITSLWYPQTLWLPPFGIFKLSDYVPLNLQTLWLPPFGIFKLSDYLPLVSSNSLITSLWYLQTLWIPPFGIVKFSDYLSLVSSNSSLYNRRQNIEKLIKWITQNTREPFKITREPFKITREPFKNKISKS
jgi:hypothetical protein